MDIATTAPIPTPDTTVAAQRRRALIAAMSDAELIAAAERYAGASYARHQLSRFISDEQAARWAARNDGPGPGYADMLQGL